MKGCRVRVASKRFGDLQVLQGLDFQVSADNFFALVGPSGAGKSTLLNILSGLDLDFEGELSWVEGGPGKIGYLFQEPRLMPWLNVRENIELVMPDTVKDQAWIDHLLRMVELSDRADAFPRQLSGGMQRRVALARAMAIKPDVLLLDEPFASLDDPTAVGLRRLVLDLWRDQPGAVILVTHNLREAMELADQVLFLSRRPARIVHREVVIPSRIDPVVVRDSQYLTDCLMRRHPDILSGIAAVPEEA
ncbi:MAG: ABC transporter ATP-binding protein [Gammaproteobacteria bacterium]|nr:ABC transporter ATP-binding protein [Gammaproteobacteria bacterium]